MRAVAVVSCLMLLTSGVRSDQPDLHRLKRSDDIGGPMEAVVAEQTQKLSALEAKLQAAENTIAASQNTIATLQTKLDTVQSSQGSSFIRWGRSVCPGGSTILYSGIAGGSYEGFPGGAVNRLCLTKEPTFDSTPLDTYYGRLEGAQYWIPGHRYTDVLCAVCRTSHSVTYMVPGTIRCPPGSTEQYHGHLSAGDHSSAGATEFLCLDGAPEDRLGSHDNLNSAWFEHVRTHCSSSSLPCPPYIEGKVVTCVVCSV